MNSIYPETDTDKLGNRVQTRFPCIEIEFNELDFHVYKPILMNSVSMYGNRVHWTRFPCLMGLTWDPCVTVLLISHFPWILLCNLAWDVLGNDAKVFKQLCDQRCQRALLNLFIFARQSDPKLPLYIFQS